MKEIIIGKCGSGKSINYVAPTIKNYKSDIIYVSTKDDRKYLGIDNIVSPVNVLNKNFIFEDNKKIFVEYNFNNKQDDLLLIQQFFKKCLDRKGLLFVIDEAFYVFNRNILNFLTHSASSEADIMIVLQNDLVIRKNIQKLSKSNQFITQAIIKNNWNIIDISNEVISFDND